MVDMASLFFLLWFGAAMHSGYCIQLTSPGELKTPNYPNKYPNKAKVEWLITAPLDHAIKIIFHDFSLESSYSCQFDYIALYEGASLLGKYCGSKSSLSHTTGGNQMKVVFKSDYSRESRGFRASISFTSIGTAAPTTIAPTTTAAPTTTIASTTSAATTTTVVPTTKTAPTTTLAPTIASAPTSTVAPTTTAAPTTTIDPTTTVAPTTVASTTTTTPSMAVPTVTATPTTTVGPTTTAAPTTVAPTTTTTPTMVVPTITATPTTKVTPTTSAAPTTAALTTTTAITATMASPTNSQTTMTSTDSTFPMTAITSHITSVNTIDISDTTSNTPSPSSPQTPKYDPFPERKVVRTCISRSLANPLVDDEKLAMAVDELKQKLSMGKNTTSRYQMKKTSARDTRSSAITMGYVAITFICVFLGAIVVPDIICLVSTIKNGFK